MRVNRIVILILVMLACLVPSSGRLSASGDSWVQYESESGVFRSRMPDDYKSTAASMAVADKRSITSEEVASVVDQRPYKNILKSYIIKIDQTFGPGLSTDDMVTLIEQELDLYKDYYSKEGGKVMNRVVDNILGYPGGEIYMTYPDEKLGTLHMKARVLFSPSTRLEQIVLGPEEVINSYKTRDFFNSLNFADGLSVTTDLLKDVWKQRASPLGLFTIGVPDVVKPFFAYEPVIKHGPQTESMTLVFKDPVRNESLYYTVYGYHFGQDLTPQNAEIVMKKNHAAKHKISTTGAKFAASEDNDKRQVLEAMFNITPPDGFPFMQTVRLRGVYDGPNMIVEEIASSQALVTSPFAQTLINAVEFHPEAYHQAAPEAAAAAPETAAPPKEEKKDALSDKLHGAIDNAVKQEAPKPEESSPPASP